MLEPATWLQGLVDLVIQPGPIVDGPLQVADVDEVERFRRKGPVELSVFDLELQVGRDPAGLCGCNISADDFRRGVCVCYVAGYG